MAELDIVKVVKAGVTPAYEAADVAGDTFSNDGNTIFHVKNDSVVSVNVTVAATTPCSQGFTHNNVVAVPAGQERMIGPFPVVIFGRSASVSYSAVADVTVAPLQLSA